MSAPTLETNGGWLRRATIPTTNAELDEGEMVIDAITDTSGNVAAVYIESDGAIELHHVPNLIHALECALDFYGRDA